MADNYGSRPISGTLNVLGSVVQWTRGNVEKYNGGGNIIVHGFSKRYRYDDRLADPAVRPPFYPGCYVKNYSITNWWESYSVMKFQ
jgi:hypothetical protein